MRKENWPHLLAQKIAACRSREFSYGSFDCFLFASECIEEITGIDYAKAFRGYDSKIAAYKIIAGYGSMEAMISSILGKEPKQIAFAQRGDIVLAEVSIGEEQKAEAVGVCDGVYSWFASQIGVIAILTMSGKCAWSIE